MQGQGRLQERRRRLRRQELLQGQGRLRHEGQARVRGQERVQGPGRLQGRRRRLRRQELLQGQGRLQRAGRPDAHGRLMPQAAACAGRLPPMPNRWGLPDLGLGRRPAHAAFPAHHRRNGRRWTGSRSCRRTSSTPRAGRCISSTRSPSAIPIVMHGVSLSVGSTDPIDFGFLDKLKALVEAREARTGSATTSAGPASRA